MGLTKLRAEQISDIDYKQAVRAITVTAIANLSGGAPNQVDGVNLSVGDRILVTAQDPGSDNGIYQVQVVGSGSNGTWIRSIDTNSTGELEAGTIVMVTEGNTYADTQWKLITNNPIVIGTTSLTFVQNSADAFGNVYANGTAILANTVGSSITITPGNNIEIIGNNTTKTVTIAVTGISLNSISNGTSNVNVVSSGGNVTVGIGGTANVAEFSTGGLKVTGLASASGNITGGNLITAGLISATSTIISAANITGGNIITAGLISATGAITGAALTGSSLTVTTGNITAGNLLLSGAIIDSAQLDIQTSAANANIALAPNGTGIVTVSTQVSAVGNVSAGNIRTAGLITATGNVQAGNIRTAGLISATSTITSAANVIGGNITTAGLITATGNITGGNIVTAGLVTATGNVQAGNLRTAGLISATSTITSAANITGGNILTAGEISATGNIAGNYFIGNGSQLTGISSNANLAVLTRDIGVVYFPITAGFLVVLARSGNISIPLAA